MRKALAFLMLTFPSAASAFRAESLGVAGSTIPIHVVAEEAMVQFAPGTSPADKAAALGRVGAAVATEFSDINWTHVKLASGTSVAAGLKQLRGQAEVLHAEPNHIYRPNIVPNDPLIPQQTNLGQVDAYAGWELETGFTNPVTIAVIDTGIDGTAGDLANKIANLGAADQSQDCSTGVCAATPAPTAACNHATRVSGIAAATANNSVGVAGISWGAKLVSLKVFPNAGCNLDCSDATFIGSCGATDASVIAALQYVRGNMTTVAGAGRLVVNMSLGSAHTSCTATDGSVAAGAVQTEMNADVLANIVLVVSAGNDASAVNQPANCAGTAGGSGIIPVGSVDSSNNISFFSSRGPELAANGVAAPGENITTTDVSGAFTASASGTSFSAPHVAGLAALVLSNKPAFTPAQVQSVIRRGADNIGQSSSLAGAGRIDVFRTMRLTARGTLADFIGDQTAVAFPNPFRVSQNGAVTLTIPVALQGSNAQIKVYTPKGVLVRTLTGLNWDGRNDAGALVASGTYVFDVTTANGHTTGRVALIR